MYNTCTIKNIDVVNHIILGVELAPNDVYTVPDEKRVKASNDSNILDLISQNKLQVGNGSTYLNTTASQINYLSAGISSVSITGADVSIDVSNNVKGFQLSRSNVDISLTQSYTDVVSINGSGAFLGMKFVFSNDEVIINFLIDDVSIFEIPVSELRDMNYESHTNVGMNRFFGGSQFGEFEFFPREPIGFTSSLKIQVKKTVSWTIKKEFHHIFYKED